MSESCPTYEWVLSHISMSHVTGNPSYYTQAIDYLGVSINTNMKIVSHTWIGHIAHTNELRMSHEWVANESRMSYEWVTNESQMSQEWVQCVTNESRMSHEWVTNEPRMSHEWRYDQSRMSHNWVTNESRMSHTHLTHNTGHRLSRYEHQHQPQSRSPSRHERSFTYRRLRHR